MRQLRKPTLNYDCRRCCAAGGGYRVSSSSPVPSSPFVVEWREMTDRVVFTFWEPRGEMIPYLQLCLETWKRNLSKYEIVVLDYSNIDDYIPEGTYDLAALKRLTLPTQKDAISVATLMEHGGVFMDVDTLAFGDLAPIFRRLEDTEVVMFAAHLAFLAARPHARVLGIWLEKIQARLAKIAKGITPAAGLPWDYIGNRTLAEAMDEIINRSAFNRMQTKAAAGLTRLLSRQGSSAGIERMPGRLEQSFLARRRHLAFATLYRKYLTVLDRKKTGYILEARGAGSNAKPRDSARTYVDFWFKGSGDLDAVIGAGSAIVGLHNSWTPQWYKEMSGDDVLKNGCLLSRTIKYILSK